MRPSAYYDREVDVMEDLLKITLLMRGRTEDLTDRYSERNERAEAKINQQIAACKQEHGFAKATIFRSCEASCS